MDFIEKNILIVLHTGSLGGAERQGLGISKILTEKYNCSVNVLLTFSNEVTPEFEKFAKECYVREILYFGPPYLIWHREWSYKNFKRLVWSAKYLWKLKNELQVYNPEIIIPFLNFPSKVSFYLYKMLPSVKFTFWHQLGLDSWSQDIFEKIAAKNIPCVIANASNGIEIYTDQYKVKQEKLNVLPQYVSMTRREGTKRLLREEFSVPQDGIVIGMVAHYRPEKYHGLLIEAFEDLVEKHSDLYLVFLGNKNNSNTTKQKYLKLSEDIKEKGLTSRVFLFSEKEVEQFLIILDIGVLMSRIEGVPNAVMEYMLYGLPVVSTNHPGCIQLLQDSPFLIRNDKRELKEALEQLITSKALRESEGRRNQKKIKSYDMASYINKLEIIMNKTISN